MENIKFFGVIMLLLIPIVWVWVYLIDKMNKEHPDYKGEDFLNTDNE